MAIERIRQMTVEEYFAFDEASEYKNEYIDGEVYPMTGSTAYHAEIMINLGIALGLRLRGGGFHVYSSAMRNSVSPTRYLYPDLSIVRGEPALDEGAVNLFNPTLVAEVISPTTAARDRGFKREMYQSIPSLQVYLVIEQFEAQVEVDTRLDENWQTREYTGLDAIVPLPALDCDLPLKEIYDGISF
ncbi:MAG: Uma2 family endonuclease [Chloroflexota bacterium]|nr:Uma2 family endonuclease [Chloroflexota bacterium]MDE2946702.1 Uma2 family endonuclease [Chloroflexota bacterium]